MRRIVTAGVAFLVGLGGCAGTVGECVPEAEIPYDGIDQDCDDQDLVDADGDGFVGREVGGNDCDDADPFTYAGAPEIYYDGVDQDCDGVDLVDVDGDG